MRPIVAAHLIACAALAAAACTPMQWVKPETTPEQLDQDAAQCQQEAWREARVRTWLYRQIAPTMVQDRQGRHLFVSPCSPFCDPSGDPLMESSRLASISLRSTRSQL